MDILNELQLVEGRDIISCSLGPVKFSVNSLYSKLSQGATVAYSKDMWAAKLPLKLKIFSWQLAIDRLPSSLNLAQRHGLAVGPCALCGDLEDASHIFFSCSLAKFSWSVLRSLLGCNWCPSSFAQFFCHPLWLLGWN